MAFSHDLAFLGQESASCLDTYPGEQARRLNDPSLTFRFSRYGVIRLSDSTLADTLRALNVNEDFPRRCLLGLARICQFTTQEGFTVISRLFGRPLLI